MNMRLSRILLTCFLLSACSLAPDYHRPAMDIPEAMKHASVTPMPDTAEKDWWGGFGSPELVTLVTQTQKQNNSLQAAAARIEQAEALAKVAGGPLWPQLSLSGSGTRGTGRGGSGGAGLNNEESGFTSASGGSRTSYRASGSLSYELDLFDRLRNTARAADATATASRYDRDSLRLTTSAQTAEAYINLLALEQRVAIAEHNLRNAREILRITKVRFNAGSLSSLEFSEQRTLAETQEAAVASLRQQREVTENMLAVLVGVAPESFSITPAPLNVLKPPPLGSVLPAELLSRRPDIASLEAQLRAANFNIGAARAAFFPSLSLSADLGLSASPASAAAKSFSSLGASLAAPLFTGGQLEGALENATARQKELAASYRQAALTAFGEAENTFSNVHVTEQRFRSLVSAADAARQAYAAAKLRFDAGAIDTLTLLNTQDTLFNAEDACIQATADRLDAAVELYKSIGGSYR